ncbi:ATP-binding protein [Nonomuraea typhae]|uniref:ATP-binding protein n=1 Tax=Nonomuraea typhae TaxID=2603600 RepID=A0ABW7Z3M6_9ACTN
MAGFEFTLAGLPGVRHFAEVVARRAGLPDDEVGDLVLAVNEVATNAVTHGSPAARVRSWTESGDLVIEIRDHGVWAGQAFGQHPPARHATSGMGLWVARLLAGQVDFRLGEEGSTVILRFAGKG